MPYSWKFYLLKAHLVDENNHTACNRQLSQSDDIAYPTLNLEHLKCETCRKYEQKQKGSGSK
jgi:hypothetical protein